MTLIAPQRKTKRFSKTLSIAFGVGLLTLFYPKTSPAAENPTCGPDEQAEIALLKKEMTRLERDRTTALENLKVYMNELQYSRNVYFGSNMSVFLFTLGSGAFIQSTLANITVTGLEKIIVSTPRIFKPAINFLFRNQLVNSHELQNFISENLLVLVAYQIIKHAAGAIDVNYLIKSYETSPINMHHFYTTDLTNLHSRSGGNNNGSNHLNNIIRGIDATKTLQKKAFDRLRVSEENRYESITYKLNLHGESTLNLAKVRIQHYDELINILDQAIFIISLHFASLRELCETSELSTGTPEINIDLEKENLDFQTEVKKVKSKISPSATTAK